MDRPDRQQGRQARHAAAGDAEGGRGAQYRVRRAALDSGAAIAAWARIGYGWMGHSPYYKAAFLNTLGANANSTASSPKARA